MTLSASNVSASCKTTSLSGSCGDDSVETDGVETSSRAVKLVRRRSRRACRRSDGSRRVVDHGDHDHDHDRAMILASSGASSNSTINSDCSAGSAVVHERTDRSPSHHHPLLQQQQHHDEQQKNSTPSTRRRNVGWLHGGAAAFIKRMDSMRASRRKRTSTSTTTPPPPGDTSDTTADTVPTNTAATTGSQTTLVARPMVALGDATNFHVADVDTTYGWRPRRATRARGGSLRVPRVATSTRRVYSLNMGKNSDKYRSDVQGFLASRRKARLNEKSLSSPCTDSSSSCRVSVLISSPTHTPPPSSCVSSVSSLLSPSSISPRATADRNHVVTTTKSFCPYDKAVGVFVYNRTYQQSPSPSLPHPPPSPSSHIKKADVSSCHVSADHLVDAGSYTDSMLLSVAGDQLGSCDGTLSQSSDVSFQSSVGSSDLDSGKSLSKSVGVVRWHSFSRVRGGSGGVSSGITSGSGAGSVSPLVRGAWSSIRRRGGGAGDCGVSCLPPSPSSHTSSGSGRGGHMHIWQLTSGQINVLKKHVLLRITASMERHCPPRSAGFSWDLPKFMRRLKAATPGPVSPSCPQSAVLGACAMFGVSLQANAQRTGSPLPERLTQMFDHLITNCHDQVGIFRKSGVRSRIQQLRQLCDQLPSGQQLPLHEFSAYDVADVVKQYFRQLPEVLLTNKVSQILVSIYQYMPSGLRAECGRLALLLLPDECRQAVHALLLLLSRLAAESHINHMPPHNLAVCLAPSLFAVGLQRSASVSPLRRRRRRTATTSAAASCQQTGVGEVLSVSGGGAAEPLEYNQTRASHECLAALIRQAHCLFVVPADLLAQCRFSPADLSEPPDGAAAVAAAAGFASPAAHTAACFRALTRECRDSRGWLAVPCRHEGVELAHRRVTDGHHLRLWRCVTDVAAPPAQVLSRILREQHVFDSRLRCCRVLESLDANTDVLYYRRGCVPSSHTLYDSPSSSAHSLCPSSPAAVRSPTKGTAECRFLWSGGDDGWSLPDVEFCVLRSWKCGLARGACAVVSTSVQHPEFSVSAGCRLGVVLACRYLVEPGGAGHSRVTHYCRVEHRGCSPEWYNKVFGHLCAEQMTSLRASLLVTSTGRESRV